MSIHSTRTFPQTVGVSEYIVHRVSAVYTPQSLNSVYTAQSQHCAVHTTVTLHTPSEFFSVCDKLLPAESDFHNLGGFTLHWGTKKFPQEKAPRFSIRVVILILPSLFGDELQ